MFSRSSSFVRRFISMALTLITALVLSSGVGVPVASGADLPGAITNVSLREGKVNGYEQLHVDLTWALPAGSKSGDTFSLTLPSALDVLSGSSFDLKTSAGVTVAVARIDGRVVTFTVSPAAEGLMNVSGSAWFSVSRAGYVGNGETPLVFTTNSQVFSDSVEFFGISSDNSDTYYKWGNVRKVNGKDVLTWGLLSRRPTIAGQTFVFEDWAREGSGFQFECGPEAVTLWGHEDGLNSGVHHWLGSSSQPRPHFQVDCSPTYFRAIYTAEDRFKTGNRFWQPEVRITSAPVIDDGLGKWSNEARITAFGSPVKVLSYVNNAGAGGVALNDSLTVEKFTGSVESGDYDSAPGLVVASGVETPVTVSVRNGGSSVLKSVVLTDETLAGVALQRLSCQLVSGAVVDAVVNGSSARVVTGEDLAPGKGFTCSGVLPALAADTAHRDKVTVTAVGVGNVSENDEFNAVGAPAVVDPSPSPSTSTPSPSESTPDVTPSPSSTTTAPPVPSDSPSTPAPSSTTSPVTPPTPEPSAPVVVPPVSTPKPEGAVAKPRVRYEWRTYQVDLYRPKSSVQARVVSRLDDDGWLKFREGRPLWGAASWAFVRVKVPVHASAAEVRVALNKALPRAKFGRLLLQTPSKLGSARQGGAYLMAWQLAPGASVKAPWGKSGKLSQRFVLRG